MSQSDPGETTDTCSTSGSGSISDWALVNEHGHLQDDDSVSTSSSVEVMEGDDGEEDVDPITPVQGNSPPGTVTQPMFVLRLTSHRVLDTDEETSERIGDSVADSNSTVLRTDTSSGPASSLTACESQAETREPATPTNTSASQVKPNLGRAVSQEDLDSLRRAIDDVQTDLLQSQAASNSLSSFHMFGPETQAENPEPSTITSEAVDDVYVKGDDSNMADDQEAGVAPPEAAAVPPEPVPEPVGQVAVDDRTADQEVETLGPAEETQLVVHRPRESWMRKIMRFVWRVYQLYREMRSDDGLMPWFLGGYVFLLSVIVALLGLIAYLTVSQGFAVKTTLEKCECPAYLTIDWKKDWDICQGRLIDVQEDLKSALAKQYELDADMRECLSREWWSLERAQYQRELDRENHQKELDDLVKQRNELKEELGACQKQRHGDSLYADPYSPYEASDDSRVKNKREPLQNEYQSTRDTLNQSDEEIVDQSVKVDEDQSKTRRNQRTSRKSSKDDENVEDKPKEGDRRKRAKEQHTKKGRGRRDSQESYRGDMPETEEEFEESDNTSGHWMENIFDIMNKTKDQIQETWSQVRNMSDHLWKKHSPTMDRLQNKFVRKIQKMSQKLKRKIEKKTKKWFGGEEKAADDDKEDRDSEKADRAKSETKRRPHRKHDAEHSTDNPKTVTTMCDPAIRELSRKFKTMNANKYHNKMTGQCRTTIKQTLWELWKDQNVQADEVLRQWVGCQELFWQNDGKGTMGDGCEAYLNCWQVRVAGGDVKKCRKLKMETGNILDGRCPVGPAPEEEVLPDKKLNCYSRPAGDARKQKQRIHDRDKLDGDDDDDGEVDDTDDELWLMARAEDRQYQRDEPDDWYFRRTKDSSPPVLPKTYSQYQSDFDDYLDIEG